MDRYGDNTSELNVTGNIPKNIKDWIDAVHFYRYEHGREESSNPSLAPAVFLGHGAGVILRWLKQLDGGNVPPKDRTAPHDNLILPRANRARQTRVTNAAWASVGVRLFWPRFQVAQFK